MQICCINGENQAIYNPEYGWVDRNSRAGREKFSLNREAHREQTISAILNYYAIAPDQ